LKSSRHDPSIALGPLTTYDAHDLRARCVDQGEPMKKLLIILILAAIGIAVVKKVREA
jgi:hypothetical protein